MPNKRKRSEISKRPKSYTTLTVEEKTMFTKIVSSAVAYGLKKAVMLEILGNAGYHVKSRTFQRHTRLLKQNKPIELENKKSGRPSKLDEYQKRIVVGWICEQNDNGVVVYLRSIQNFIRKQFGVKVSQSFISGMLPTVGISSRKVKTKGFTKKINLKKCVDEYSNFIKLCREKRYCDKLHASIDFTYTSHRTYSVRSFSRRGSDQPKICKMLSKYTNCIVTLVWSDGVNRTPSMVFTYNPEFCNAGECFHVSTKAFTLTIFRFLGNNAHTIDGQRICYLDQKQHKKSTYCKESPEIVNMFLEHYENVLPEDLIIFSDSGTCFMNKGADIINDAGLIHVKYPPCVHQYISPNDNKLHGVAKRAWRADTTDFSDDVDSTLKLMKLMDNVKQTSIRGWFKKNFFIGHVRPMDDDFKNFMNGANAVMNHFYDECQNLYRRDVLNQKNDVPTELSLLENDLDGAYWNEK